MCPTNKTTATFSKNATDALENNTKAPSFSGASHENLGSSIAANMKMLKIAQTYEMKIHSLAEIPVRSSTNYK